MGVLCSSYQRLVLPINRVAPFSDLKLEGNSSQDVRVRDEGASIRSQSYFFTPGEWGGEANTDQYIM